MNHLDRNRKVHVLVEGNSMRSAAMDSLKVYLEAVEGVGVFGCEIEYAILHKTLRMTPAMAAGAANKLWMLEDLLELVEQKIYRSN